MGENVQEIKITSDVIGIDPGMSGGLAWTLGGKMYARPMPKTEADINDLFYFIHPLDFALIEKVHAMPRQGVTSMFKFGMNYGFLRGLLIAHEIPFEEVTPQRWQKALGCLTKGDKNITKAKAQQLFPELRVTHATADAILICEYARRKYALNWSEI